MTRRNMQPKKNDDSPKVVIFAPTIHHAQSLARELGILGAIHLGPQSVSRLKGVKIATLIVEHSMWPMPRDFIQSAIPSLNEQGGYIIHARRIDPKPQQKAQSA